MASTLTSRWELIVGREQLRRLLALAEHHDLKGAAAALRLDEAELEASLRALERTLAAPLLEGSSGAAILTPIGALVCRQARVLLPRAATGDTIDLLSSSRGEGVVASTTRPGLPRPETEMDEVRRKLLDRRTREHLRIGHELHDVVGQELTGLAYLARGLADSLDVASPARAIAAKLEAGLDRALGEVRTLARGLVPVTVGPDGLRSATAELVERMSAPGTTRCSFECSGPVHVDDSLTATHLFRIAQEAVTNARRHARASEVRVRLEAGRGTIRLEVRDDGCGFPSVVTPGTGLRTMEYRADQIGARLEITRRAGGGTVVSCTLPLEWRDEPG